MAGLSHVTSPMIRDTALISALVSPASMRGFLIPISLPASRPGRKSPGSSALAPLTTDAKPRSRAIVHISA